MKILHVSPYFAPAFVYGGPPRSVLGLCKALRRAGVEAEVAATAANGAEDLSSDVAGAGEYEGVPARYFPRSFPRSLFRSAGLKAYLARVAGEHDLAHIHGCWNFASWDAGAAFRLLPLPYVLSPRGMLEPWSFAHGRIKKRIAYSLFERRNVAGAAAIHATTAEERDGVERLGLGVPTRVIPNGLALEEFETMPEGRGFRQRHGIGAGDLLALFLGRIHVKKGLETLCSAFERVAAANPAARLAIVGEGDADYVGSLRARFAASVGRRAIIFAGKLEGAARLEALAAADIFALASHSENFGLSIAEAMASGKPVVISRECPWPEIESWGAGARVENSPEAFAEALGRLAGDGELRRRMGASGRREMFAHYSWSRVAEEMRGLYEEILARRKAKR